MWKGDSKASTAMPCYTGVSASILANFTNPYALLGRAKNARSEWQYLA
jgi:hypothetical protein